MKVSIRVTFDTDNIVYDAQAQQLRVSLTTQFTGYATLFCVPISPSCADACLKHLKEDLKTSPFNQLYHKKDNKDA